MPASRDRDQKPFGMAESDDIESAIAASQIQGRCIYLDITDELYSA